MFWAVGWTEDILRCHLGLQLFCVQTKQAHGGDGQHGVPVEEAKQSHEVRNWLKLQLNISHHDANGHTRLNEAVATKHLQVLN